MADDSYIDTSITTPCHPGFLIKTFLMPNFSLNEHDIAKEMGTTRERATAIILEREGLTDTDVDNLRKRFGAAADNMLRVQQIFDFFKQHNRRPTWEERQQLFGRPTV